MATPGINWPTCWKKRGGTAKRRRRIGEPLRSMRKTRIITAWESRSTKPDGMQKPLSRWKKPFVASLITIRLITDLGVTLENLERHKQAIAAYRHAIALKPG